MTGHRSHRSTTRRSTSTGRTARPAGPRRTQAERIEETRSLLISATIESLVELGYAATTTREVAERAGVSRGAQTHHFPTKALLVAATIEHLFATEAERFRAAFEAAPAEERNLANAVEVLWQIVQHPTYGAILEVLVAARTDHQLALVVHKVSHDFERTIVDLLLEVFPSVEGDELLARTLVDLAFTVVQGAVISGYAGFGDQDRTIALARAVASFITPQSGTAILSALGVLDPSTRPTPTTEEPA